VTSLSLLDNFYMY